MLWSSLCCGIHFHAMGYVTLWSLTCNGVKGQNASKMWFSLSPNKKAQRSRFDLRFIQSSLPSFLTTLLCFCVQTGPTPVGRAGFSPVGHSGVPHMSDGLTSSDEGHVKLQVPGGVYGSHWGLAELSWWREATWLQVQSSLWSNCIHNHAPLLRSN